MLLDAVAPAHNTLCRAQIDLLQSSPHSVALRRASDALAQLAVDLGYPGRFAAKAPARPGQVGGLARSRS